ncbi:hypothetical protein Osc7112_3533 [Oscillatoria nigro-viridis PCC 7112]|uniref:TonB family protein n=1 Tax=Phormidium nigroviride PCC 7112 TaxID=179408 RepID=K9VKY7_9CYAN|nr:hypothetical protein [Oscillatoria nigro-viridis]AFZ07900.1 hypothetical protein Osc7112_3533 [Oscillatoria nigro-viridis PCC 7112]
MTDSSSLANTLSEPLRQPYWWAALASVSLHGVLGVSAPTLSNILFGGNSSKNIPGSVGIVELTPAEVSRLPQTIPPKPSNTRFTPFSIAPVPLPPAPKLAPPLPPAPDTINLPAMPPGMPPPGFFSPLPPSPLPPFTAPTAPPPPKTPSPTVRTPSQPTTPTIIPPVPPSGLLFPPLPGNFDRNIPPPPSMTEAPQLPGGGSEDEAETLKKIIASRGGLPLFPDGAPVFTPEFPIGRNVGPDGVPKLTQKDPNKRNLIAETPEERIKRQQFEEGQRQLGQSGQPGANLPTDRETQLAAANTYVALFEKFKKAYPDLEMTSPTPVNVPYPVTACSQKLQGTAVFGAVVSPQGLLKAEPQPIVPTGYSILDNTAKIAIISPSLTFSAASTHKLYQLTVDFKYDEKVCSGIPATPTRPNPPGQQRPAPAPTAPRPTGQQPSPAPTEVKPQFEKPPAPSTKPQPGAKPSPSAPKPAAQPSPSPEPKPAAEQSPSPQPQPAQESPQPEAAPSPAPEVSPSPEAAPSPAPEVSPSPEAAPSPAPEVSPSPAAEVSPSPAPEVSPSPEAAPSPAATEK